MTTIAQRKHMGRVAQLGCAVCFRLNLGVTPAELHHHAEALAQLAPCSPPDLQRMALAEALAHAGWGPLIRRKAAAMRAAHRRATTPRRVALRTKTTTPQD